MSLLHLKIEPTLNASTRKVIIIWYIPKIGYFYMQFSDLSLWWMNGRKLGSIYNRLTLDVFSKGFNEKEYLHWLSGYNFLWYDISEKPCWKLWDWNLTGTKKWQFY